MPGAGAAAIGLSALGTVFSIKQQREQAKTQRRVRREQRKKQQVQARRQRVRAFAEQRRSQAVARAQAAGMSGGAGLASSAFQGAVSAVGTNTASNIGFANQVDAISQRQTQIMQEGADRANLFGTLGQVAQLGSDVAGSDLFGQGTPDAGGGG